MVVAVDEESLEVHPAAAARKQNPLVRYCKRLWTVETAKRMFPPYLWVPKYRVAHLVGDVIAGLTVGLTVVPQGLAYAKVANLPLQYGLYSAFMGPFMYCLLGTSKDIAVGPTAVISLLVASSAPSPVAGDPTYALFTTLYVGIIHLAMAFLNIGFIVQFISHPVINAFTSAAAVTIISTQVKSWLGLKNVRQDFFGAVYDTFSKLPQTNKWDATIGLLCMAVLVGAKHLKEKVIDKKLKQNPATYKRVLLKIAWILCIGRNACVVIIAAAIAAGLQANGYSGIFTLTPNINQGLPKFQLPAMSLNATIGNKTIVKATNDIFQDIGIGLPIIALMCVLEHVAVGKSFARKNGYRLIPSQEMLALGVCNFLGSFVGSYPVTGSVSRTAVNSASGVMTPAGGIVTGAVVLLAIALLTPYFVFIPQAALAAVVICAVGDMIDYTIVKSIWLTKKIDLIPLFATFLLSFPWGIEYGVIIGTGINLLMIVYPMSRPHVDLRRMKAHGSPVAAAPDATLTKAESAVTTVATVIRVNPGLQYPGVEYLYDKIVKHGPQESPQPQSVVLDCAHWSSVDYTTIHALEGLGAEFSRRKLKLILVHLREDIKATVMSGHADHVIIAGTMSEAKQLLLSDGCQSALTGSVSDDSCKKENDASRSNSIASVGSGRSSGFENDAVDVEEEEL